MTNAPTAPPLASAPPASAPPATGCIVSSVENAPPPAYAPQPARGYPPPGHGQPQAYPPAPAPGQQAYPPALAPAPGRQQQAAWANTMPPHQQPDPFYKCCCPPCAWHQVEGCSPATLCCFLACLWWPVNGLFALCMDPDPRNNPDYHPRNVQQGYPGSQPAQVGYNNQPHHHRR